MCHVALIAPVPQTPLYSTCIVTSLYVHVQCTMLILGGGEVQFPPPPFPLCHWVCKSYAKGIVTLRLSCSVRHSDMKKMLC